MGHYGSVPTAGVSVLTIAPGEKNECLLQNKDYLAIMSVEC